MTDLHQTNENDPVTHMSDCFKHGFDMPDQGIIHADHCSCQLETWICPRCKVQHSVWADIRYLEHQCPDGVLQALEQNHQ